jgi:putative ABC transport system substrate-binding protein
LLQTARGLGLELHVLQATSEGDFDEVFSSLVQLHAAAMLIATDGLFTARSYQLAMLALRHAIPAISSNLEFAAAGGLISYGSSVSDGFRLAGVYTGRILKGEKPSDLPVQQSTKIELKINLKTAKALGLTVPPALLARADEVFE